MLVSAFLAVSPADSSMRVLIVEDDAMLADGLTATLRHEGFVVDSVASAEQAEAAIKVSEIDLIILDIGLPGMDGFTWLRRLRSRGDEQAVLVLTARVSALARRGRAIRSRVIEHGPLTIDLARKRAMIHGKPIDLPQREHAILEYLFSNIDAIVGKEKIASAVASWDEHISANAIEVHISRLRAKLEPSGIRIRTVRGLGYIVEPWSDEKPQA
jgi:two-component system OmpR family response regulator